MGKPLDYETSEHTRADEKLRVEPMTQIDPDIKKLQDEIYRSKVLRARRMSIAEKISAGEQLFHDGIEMMRASIRTDHPEYSEEQVDREIDRRFRIAKKISDGNIYRDAGVIDE